MAAMATAVEISPPAARAHLDRSGLAVDVDEEGRRQERALSRLGVGPEPRQEGPAPAAMLRESPWS